MKKTFFIFFKKSIDNRIKTCYNSIIKRGEERTMTEWMMNAENHAEDCEELKALWAEVFGEEEGAKD